MTDLNLSMFRAYDIRTPSTQLTDELAERLCNGEAIYFRDSVGTKKVVLAHDARANGPRYLEIGVAAFRRAGLDVVVVPGVCSTSMFYFAAMKYPDHAGVMFGASHNPAGDTGQKIVGPNVRPIAEHIGPDGGLDKIVELYQAGEKSTDATPGKLTTYDPLEDYVAYSMQLAGVEAGSLHGFSIFHDYLNGAAGREMIHAFGLAGANLKSLHANPDGSFPLGDPNPVKTNVVREGIEELASGAYAMANFFDGDGDRIDFYHGSGTYISSSFAYAAILPYIRERFSADGLGVYADLKSNPLAIMQMASTGFKIDVVRNGHSQIKESIASDSYKVGAVEESAHYYEKFILDGGEYSAENTLYISLLGARAFNEHPERIAELLNIQSQTAREREWGYKFSSDELRASALDAVKLHFESIGAKSLTRMANGLDLEATMMRIGIPFEVDVDTHLQSGWGQVCQRTSQSENGLARWEVCAENAEIAARAKQDVAQIVKEFGAGEEYQG
ncbi:MAG: phosphoglucomutase [Chthonomonadales bacterium]